MPEGEIMTERRYTAGLVELRADGQKKRIAGYAAVFDRVSHNLGGFVEQVRSGFFAKSRGDGWPGVVARFDHENSMLLGTMAGGTLRLSTDEAGLWYEVEPPAARADILELVERGDVSKSSFAFRVFEDEWDQTDQGFPQRSLLSGQLIDVAPVVSPAYEDTSAGLRSLAEHVGAGIEEVRKLAESNELRKFFRRTDIDGGKPMAPTAAQARMSILARETDPYT